MSLTTFVQNIENQVLVCIRERLKKELYPQIEQIVDEEVARYSIDLQEFMETRSMDKNIVISIAKKDESL